MYPGARVGLKRRSSGKVLTSGILRRRSRASRGHTEARRQAWTGPPPGTSLAWPLTAGVQLPELEAPASVVAPACGVCSWFLGLAEGFPVVNFSLSFHGVCCLQRCCRLEKELILRSAGEGAGGRARKSLQTRRSPHPQRPLRLASSPLPESPGQMTNFTVSQPWARDHSLGPAQLPAPHPQPPPSGGLWGRP